MLTDPAGRMTELSTPSYQPTEALVNTVASARVVYGSPVSVSVREAATATG